MSSKRKGGNSTNFNFRPQTESKKWETKGTRPLPNPVTVQETLLTMVVQFCRKVIFFNTKLRVLLYIAGLFLSFIFDVLPFPKSYFSRTDNIFNQYFVKIGWGWTLFLTTPFVLLTSFTYCCGNRKMVLMHLSRLGIATAVWFIFTKMFSLIEINFGKCSRTVLKTKNSCISDGYFWHSLDISGHAFILMWSTLVIVEEARVMTGWESIKDLIRNESHCRTTNEPDIASPLKKLTDDEFLFMRSSYNNFTLYVKALFISMTALTIIWDLMIVSTLLYFHIMIEKFIAGLLAAGMWVLTYNYWYVKLKFPPPHPGIGLFKYTKEIDRVKDTSVKNKPYNSLSSKRSGPVPVFPSTNLMKPTEKDRTTKDDINMNLDQDIQKKSDRTKSEETLSQPITTGVTTRSQALRNMRLDGNKTV
ncbi:UNVERIFIED_CONTAM: hypothetical protein PYX00_007846 [Menopon gallinae]|uniref:FIT family protein n=1 Tax=Menopon gallinae TaxID=328185 RepID=A0AAW2HKW7_9NEOP